MILLAHIVKIKSANFCFCFLQKMLLRKLPGFVGHGSKETKTLLLLQNHCKKINQQYFSKWKKMNSCCVSCSTFVHQQRRMGTQKIPSEIKSPFRNLDIPNITITELLWDKIDRFPDHTAIVSIDLNIKIS